MGTRSVWTDSKCRVQMVIDLEKLRRDLGVGELRAQAKREGATHAATLLGRKVLFTGKLGSGFTRAEAEGLVRKAGGDPVSHISKDLDYLVVGDEGSPLYGDDSKIARAKRLNAEGAKIKVLSEKAFLKLFGISYGKL